MMQEDYFEQYMRKYYRDWKLDYTRYYPFYLRMPITEQLLQITHIVYRKDAKKKIIFDYRPAFTKEHDKIVNFAADNSICLDAALQVYRKELDLSMMSRKEIRDFIDEHIQLCTKLKVEINLQAKLNLVKNL
jgi:hypothetical protein